MSSVTNNTVSNADLAAALANITKYLGDAEKNNVKADKNVLNHFLTVVQQYENQQQAESAGAPAIPSPPGTLTGDLRNSINIFGSSNEINISYIVSLVLALTSLESQQLSKQFELQTAANILQYKSGLAAADDAQAAAVAGAVGSFTSAALSLASLGVEALGAFKANKAGAAASSELTEQNAKGGLAKEVEEAQGGSETKAANEFELQQVGGSRSGKTVGNTGATETEVQNDKSQNQSTATADNQGTERVEQSAARTRLNVAQTERNASLNASEATEAETSFNGPESTEGASAQRSSAPTSETAARIGGSEENSTTGSLQDEEAAPNQSETQELGANRSGNTEQSSATTEVEKNPSGPDSLESTSNNRSTAATTNGPSNTKAETPQPDRNVADQQNNPRAGASDETRNAEQTNTNKANTEEAETTGKTEKSKPPSDFEKLARDLRKAIRPDLEQKVTQLDKLRAFEKAYDRVNLPYSIAAKGLQSAAGSAQGAGQLAQGGLTKLQLVEQANAQLNAASSQSASQTIQQLQEVINNARNLVNGLLQSEFSVSRSA